MNTATRCAARRGHVEKWIYTVYPHPSLPPARFGDWYVRAYRERGYWIGRAFNRLGQPTGREWIGDTVNAVQAQILERQNKVKSRSAPERFQAEESNRLYRDLPVRAET